MDKSQLYAKESEKTVSHFVSEFRKVCEKNQFVINNTDSMNMASSFNTHGASVPENFDLHMMQICMPLKASKSLIANPERSILMPKFVMAFSQNGRTQIRYLSYSKEDISALVDDQDYPESLAQTSTKIRSMIDEAR